MQTKFLIPQILLLLLTCRITAQDFPGNEAEFETQYANRIQLAEIDGVYIPKDLEDAFAELKRLASPADIARFKAAPDEIVRSRFHFGLGKWMIANWGFYEGSRLSHYLKEKGVLHPDDMARVLLVCFHRHLNQLDMQFEEEVAFYQALREKERLERESRKEVISEEKHVKKD